MFFLRDVELQQRFVYRLSQICQFRARLNTDPEYSRRVCSREKSVAATVYFNRGGFDCLQRSPDSRNFCLRLFADELERDVQRFRTHPARIGSETAHAIEEASDALANALVDIQCDEKAHRKKLLATG